MWGRNRFILSFVLVALVALLAYGVIVFATTMRVLDQVSHDEARSQWQALRRALHALPTELLRVTQDYAGRPEIRALLANPSSDSQADDMAQGIARSFGVSLAQIMTPDGDIRYGTPLTARQHEDLLATNLARDAGDGTGAGGIYLVNGLPTILAAAPINAPDAREGDAVLLLGRPLDNVVMDQLKGIFGRDIILSRHDAVYAGSRTSLGLESNLILECPEGSPSSAVWDVTRQELPDGRVFATAPVYTTNGVSLGCLHLEIPASTGTTLSAAITLASLIAILLGLAASYILARTIGGRLAASADALAEGERENARLYAEVQRLNRQLESLVSERTSQLRMAVSELQQAQNQLVQEDRLAALGTLVAGIVHELATPLTTVLVASHVLLSELKDEALREAVEQVRDAALKGQEIVTRIRTFARRQRVRRELIDLNAVVHEAIDLLRYQLVQSRVSYDLDLAPSLPKIMVDQTQTQQVLVNLVNHARETLEKKDGPRNLTLRTGRTDGKVFLSVIDNGPSMAPEALDHIFDPFYTTEKAGIASGLGLYICRSIVEGYEGHITASAREDSESGTVFTIELPTGISQLAGAGENTG